jgi:subtilisin family serine protease
MKLSILLIVTVCLIFAGFIARDVRAEDPGYSTKIVLFHEEVLWDDVRDYANQWGLEGVSIIRELPLIKCLVLRVPSHISAVELAADPRVVNVEDDQAVRIQAVSAAADGGAADGGAADGGAADGGAGELPSWSFIEPVSQPTPGDRPWGILKLYKHLQHPELITDYLAPHDVPNVIKKVLSRMKSRSIRIALFDTGIDYSHPSLAGKVYGGIDITTMTNGVPMDDNGHGTHIAGTLCASLRGHPFGLIPSVRLYSVKLLDRYATGNLYNIISGLDWAIKNRIDIVNMSISYRDNSPAVHRAVQRAYQVGMIIVAAAGNRSNWLSPTPGVSAVSGAADGGAADGGAADGGAADGGAGGSSGTGSDRYPVMYPARYPEVISVGASTPYGTLAGFSNADEELDITAPGTRVVSTNLRKRGGFGLCSGTSMATSHVTGAIAMMLALDPTLKVPEIKTILWQTADMLTNSDFVGYDLNLVAALGVVWQGAGNDEDNKEQEVMRIMKRMMTDLNFQSIDKKE